MSSNRMAAQSYHVYVGCFDVPTQRRSILKARQTEHKSPSTDVITEFEPLGTLDPPPGCRFDWGQWAIDPDAEAVALALLSEVAPGKVIPPVLVTRFARTKVLTWPVNPGFSWRITDIALTAWYTANRYAMRGQ